MKRVWTLPSSVEELIKYATTLDPLVKTCILEMTTTTTTPTVLVDVDVAKLISKHTKGLGGRNWSWSAPRDFADELADPATVCPDHTLILLPAHSNRHRAVLHVKWVTSRSRTGHRVAASPGRRQQKAEEIDSNKLKWRLFGFRLFVVPCASARLALTC